MEKKSTFGPIVLFGLGTGILMVLFALITYLLDIDRNTYVNLLMYIFPVAGMWWGTVNIRENRLGGVMSYGKAFGTGFYIGFVAAIVLAVYMYYYVTVINPGVMDEAVAEAEKRIIESNPDISDELLDQLLETVKLFTNPILSALSQLVSFSIISVIISLIIAIFVKREDRTIA